MKSIIPAACCALLLGLPWLARAGGPYGADNGWAVDHSSGAVLLTSAVASQMSKGETGWIRIEMSLVSGHSTWDSTVLGYYDSAVNNARNAGLQVLLPTAITPTSAGSPQMPSGPSSNISTTA